MIHFDVDLEKAGISSTTLYPVGRMAELMGGKALKILEKTEDITLYEEYFFQALQE